MKLRIKYADLFTRPIFDCKTDFLFLLSITLNLYVNVVFGNMYVTEVLVNSNVPLWENIFKLEIKIWFNILRVSKRLIHISNFHVLGDM